MYRVYYQYQTVCQGGHHHISTGTIDRLSLQYMWPCDGAGDHWRLRQAPASPGPLQGQRGRKWKHMHERQTYEVSFWTVVQ